MIKAALFDLDGTLIDSNNAIFQTYIEVSRKLDEKEPSIDTLRSLLGQPSHINLEYLFGKNEKARPIYNEVVKKTHANLDFLPFVKETLEKINIPKGIVTSKRSENALEVLKELKDFFVVIITPEQTIKQKPNPEPIYTACEKLSIKPEECVYIGDTVRDYQTAVNSGTKFIALIDKGSTSEQFSNAGAKNQVISFNLIPDMINKL